VQCSGLLQKSGVFSLKIRCGIVNLLRRAVMVRIRKLRKIAKRKFFKISGKAERV